MPHYDGLAENLMQYERDVKKLKMSAN
jgi:hypothetical protein